MFEVHLQGMGPLFGGLDLNRQRNNVCNEEEGAKDRALVYSLSVNCSPSQRSPSVMSKLHWQGRRKITKMLPH